MSDPVQATSDSVQAAPAQTDITTNTPTPEATFEVVVDGVKQSLTIAQLTKGYSLEQSSQKRFQSAAAKERAAQDLEKLASDNPEEFFRRTGKDPHKFAEDLLLKRLEWEAKSPEAKEAHKAREQSAKLQRELDAYQAAEKAKAQSDADAAAVIQIDQEIGAALKGSGLTASARVIARVAEYMLRGASAKQAVTQCRTDYSTDIQDLLGTADEDTLLSAVPEKVWANLRKADTKRSRLLAKPTVQVQAPERAATSQKSKSLEDFFKALPTSD